MSANNAQYMQLFGMICNEAVVMAPLCLRGL